MQNETCPETFTTAKSGIRKMAIKNHQSYKRFFKAALCFVCLTVALSFFATLVPIAGASSNNTMPCCVGKDEGHCDSGIPAKKVHPPTSEPMCGLDNSELADDAITIVAEPSHNESHHSLSQTAETTLHAAESTSVSKSCQMECGACAASSSRQQKRERGIPQATADHDPFVTIHSRFRIRYSPFHRMKTGIEPVPEALQPTSFSQFF